MHASKIRPSGSTLSGLLAREFLWSEDKCPEFSTIDKLDDL
jgi:hypothetical protein